mmetsp:Transcript_44006/g.81346  ORF Transcript_44006/g.81346 Transcript_44006/m.81346 type:complete len:100 (-) Transcript_44006:80-379(-)
MPYRFFSAALEVNPLDWREENHILVRVVATRFLDENPRSSFTHNDVPVLNSARPKTTQHPTISQALASDQATAEMGRFQSVSKALTSTGEGATQAGLNL